MNIEAASNTNAASEASNEGDNTNLGWDSLSSTDDREIWELRLKMAGADFFETLETSFESMTPIQQIALLPSIYFAAADATKSKNIAEEMHWVYGLNDFEMEPHQPNESKNALAFFERTQKNPKIAPLVRIVSENYNLELSDDLKRPVYVSYSTAEKPAKKDKDMIIAPGITAPLVRQFGYAKPDLANLSEEYNKDNSLKLDEESVMLLGAAHSFGVNQLIDKKIGLKLQDISLPAQIQLLKYMTKVGDERFEKLCNGLNRVEPDVGLKLAEGFLAADFGEDFGDALIDIAESKQLTTKQVGEILSSVDSCRKSIKEIAGLYQNFDNGNFAKEYEKSSNERLTDALTAFKEIAKNGVASSDLDWAGKPEFNYDSAMEALKYEVNSLEIISGTLGDVNAGIKGAFAETVMHQDPLDQRLRRTVYNFYSPQHGYVLLYTRPEGSHSFDPMTEYGKMRSRYNTTTSNVGVEASISLITNPVDPFSLPSPFRPDPRALKNPHFYDTSTMNKVSAIRLDREGRAREMAADDPNRDPINPLGMVSVDLAAIGDRADTPSGKIARLISTGGKLREEASKTDFSLNHNTKWFDQDRYGTSSGFKTLVNYIDTMAKQWCKEHAPENDVQSFSRLMKQARGRKVIRRAA